MTLPAEFPKTINADLAAGGRVFLVLQGEHKRSLDFAASLVHSNQLDETIWLSPCDRQGLPGRKNFNVSTLIGAECQIAVYDAYTEFDPDMFGALAGTVVGGGVLLLITPPLGEWPARLDAFSRRIAIAGSSSHVPSRFIQRLIGQMHQHKVVCLDVADCPINSFDHIRTSAISIAGSNDQQRAIEAVMHVVSGQRRRPLLLCADRGRGKSAALGIAAARLMKIRNIHIGVTAVSRQSCDVVFRHLARELGVTVTRGSCDVSISGSKLSFVDPQQLPAAGADFELLLVDEAAALGLPLLNQLLVSHSRLVFATTVHGYEGSGRGFAVRFEESARARSRGFQKVELVKPIRWYTGDRLEAFVNDALLLKPPASGLPESGEIEFRQISAVELSQDEPLLREVYGLLAAAHYRTRPFDLRHLLDASNVQIHIAMLGTCVVGVLLATLEGGLDEITAANVVAGQSRPRGHTLPGIIAAHLGRPEGMMLTCARIMRIAVDVRQRRRGVGTGLVRSLLPANTVDRSLLPANTVDYVGTAYSLTQDVMSFWRSLGFQPVRIGLRANLASGSPSVAMICTNKGASTAFCRELVAGFKRSLVLRLAGSYRELDVDEVIALIEAVYEPLREHADLSNFTRKKQSLDAAFERLWELAPGLIASMPQSAALQRRLVVMAILQQKSLGDCAKALGISGYAECEAMLRAAYARPDAGIVKTG